MRSKPSAAELKTILLPEKAFVTHPWMSPTAGIDVEVKERIKFLRTAIILHLLGLQWAGITQSV
jgi:hypothetical protein